MATCTICRKRAVSGNAVSHSQIHTKRRFKPNLQKVNGLVLCTSCLKTIKTAQRIEREKEQARKEAAEAEAAKETVIEEEPKEEKAK
jgi:large subunit ribosomal protein L28